MLSRKFVVCTLLLGLLGVGSLIYRQKFGRGKGTVEDARNFPRSVALIMDGNGRWAKKRGLPVARGHQKGAETLERISEYAQKMGIKSLTLFAFSTENWGRSKEEVDHIIELVNLYLDKHPPKLVENNVKLRVIGDLGRLDPNTRRKIEELEERTKDNDGLFLNIAFSYGGRAEIVHAAKNIARAVQAGSLGIEEINEDTFRRYLYNPDIIYPDFVIRTGGYLRISNFLLWEISYSELYFTEVLWPDFDEKCLDRALKEFKKRKRTYGRR